MSTNSNKPDMIPIGVIDRLVDPLKVNIVDNTKSIEKLMDAVIEIPPMIVTPIKENITNTHKELEKLMDAVTDLAEKINEHDKDCDNRTDQLQKCLTAKNNENMTVFRTRAKEVDDRMLEEAKILEDLKRSNVEFDKVATRVESLLKDVQDKVKTMIIVVAVGFGIFLAVYGIATYMAKASVGPAVDSAVKQIINTRGEINHFGVMPYWVDDTNVKRYIMVEPGDANAPKNLPTK